MAFLCLTTSSPTSHGFFFASPAAAADLLVLGFADFWREPFEAGLALDFKAGLALDRPPKRHGLLARAGTRAGCSGASSSPALLQTSSAHHKRNAAARARDLIAEALDSREQRAVLARGGDRGHQRRETRGSRGRLYQLQPNPQPARALALALATVKLAARRVGLLPPARPIC